MKTALSLLTSVAALTVMSTAAAAQKQVTFTKDVAPILPGTLPGLSSCRHGCADVVGDLFRGRRL